MFDINNEKNKFSVILNPERSEWVSRSHVTGVEPVVNDGAKTKPHHALRRSLRALAYGSTLKMTEKALSLSGALSEPIISAESKKNQPRYSVNCCAIPEYDRFGFGFAKVLAFAFLLSLNLSESWAVTCNFTPDPNNAGKYSLEVKGDSGGNVFGGCKNGFPDGLSKWSDVSSKITSATLDKNITSIGASAFEGASSLTSITLPDSVTSIGWGAFWGASSLESITIPKGVTSIGGQAFYGASSLTSITIPEGVTSIGGAAFCYAESLTSITLPEGVTRIGGQTFYGASSLTSITIPEGVTSIGDEAFAYASSLTNIMCKGDETSCADTVNALRAKGYTGNISYPTDKTSCEGTGVSLFVWDGSKCGRRNEEQCNSVAKYYYSNGKCQVLPKTQSACTGTNIEWNATDNKCVNKNYTPSQEANNGNTGGDVSGDFNPADCYNNGQVPYNNQCLDEYPFAKKRWTPAEANEWLHDGNDNFVVITFKK